MIDLNDPNVKRKKSEWLSDAQFSTLGQSSRHYVLRVKAQHRSVSLDIEKKKHSDIALIFFYFSFKYKFNFF